MKMGQAVFVAVVLMAMLMVSDSQAKDIQTAADVFKRDIQGADKQIADLVTKHEARKLGKRSADLLKALAARRSIQVMNCSGAMFISYMFVNENNLQPLCNLSFR